MCTKKCDGVRDLEASVFAEVEKMQGYLASLLQLMEVDPHVPQRFLDRLDGLDLKLRKLKAMVAPYDLAVAPHRRERVTLRNADIPE
jgi:hypothetical protein